MANLSLRNFRIDTHASLAFDFRRRPYTAITQIAQQKNKNPAESETATETDKNYFLAVWLDRLFVYISRINNTHVTDFACTHHTELLDIVQNRRIEFIIDFDILLELQHILLRRREFLCFAFFVGKFFLQPFLLLQNSLHRRMVRLEQTRFFLIRLLQ